MAHIITINNPLTGQPQQVIRSDYPAQRIDDVVAAMLSALPGGSGLPVSQGGTGANTPQKALVNLGARPNRNLLDNAYFVGGGDPGGLPINQRGLKSYSSTIAIDRWRISGNGAEKAEVQEDGILLTSTAQYGAYWAQNLDPAIIETMIGKTVTASIYMGDNNGFTPGGSIYRNGEYFQTINTPPNDIGTITFEVPAGTTSMSIQVGALGAGTAKIKAAKMEVGDKQTLGYKDSSGTVHLLEAPDHGEELLRCKRYFQRFGPNAGIGIVQDAANAYMLFPISVPFRTTPALIVSSTIGTAWTMTQAVQITGITLNDRPNGDTVLFVSVSGNFTGVTPGTVITAYVMQFDATAEVS